ncbi:MAG TPA: ATP-binding protein [Anaerolineales bacterium]|jgi:signal transduction histidine kinase
MSKILNWVVRKHWWLLGFVALMLLLLEGVDIIQARDTKIHFAELVIYLVMLAIIGVLYDSAFRAVHSRAKINNLIEYKHKLSLEFSIYNDWDVLVTQLTRFPGSIAPVESSSLYVCDSISNQFELVSLWPPDQKMANPELAAAIKKHLQNNSGELKEFSPVGENGSVETSLANAQTFCLPIRFGQGLLGLIGFKLKDGQALSIDQRDVFKNIGDEIGFAFKVGQDRKAYLEMNASETTLAERRRVSHFLHDHLGHNLGYLHLKLDQMILNKEQLTIENVVEDLAHLRKAAADSYEIVRGTLEAMQPQTTPMLNNLLMEHARQVSNRANIEIDFHTTGNQFPLTVDIKRVIFYVFEEALSNAEKHARASKITVFTDWNEDSIAMTISDNGVGFNPEDVNTDRHFGLEILRERLEAVGGQVSLVSSEDAGTTISVWIPLPVGQQSGMNL